MRCETCKKEMKYFKSGFTCGWNCTHCGNQIVTTYYDEIACDDSLYTISIIPQNETSAINIKLLSKISHCSFINAKDLLISGVNLGSYNSIETRNILQSLNHSTIKYVIQPPFKHDLS